MFFFFISFFVLAIFFFFFNDTATTEIYPFPYTTLFRSSPTRMRGSTRSRSRARWCTPESGPQSIGRSPSRGRSEEHTSELQSQSNLVCRLLLEKKKKKIKKQHNSNKTEYSTNLGRTQLT